MANPFLGEIRMGGWNFAPAGWAMCDGSQVLISTAEALFNLIGTTYGGDGKQYFLLPDLRGRVPAHVGSSPGAPALVLGQQGGTETVTLTGQQTPTHSHPFMASTSNGNLGSPVGNVPATTTAKAYAQATATDALAAGSIPVGSNAAQPHDNMQPYLGITFIIALNGIFPTQG